MLNNQNEQLSLDAQKSIDKAMEMFTTSIQSVEKLTRIQLDASRQILEDTTKALKELTTVSDSKDALNRINEMTANNVEKNIVSARDVYNVIDEVSQKVYKLAEENIQAIQQSALNSVGSLAKYSPSTPQAVTDTLKNWVANTNQAMLAVSKVASQVKEFASNNLHAATNATVSAVKKAVDKE